MFLLTLFLNLATLLLLLFPIIFIHEIGHAVTARILGFKVFSVTMGHGKKLFTFDLFEIPFTFNFVPIQGITMALAKTRTLFRTRRWIYVAGGPLTHILAVYFCYLIWGKNAFWEAIYPRNLFLGFAPLTVFIYANVFLFCNSMIPLKLHLPTGTAYTDGYQLITIPFSKTQWLKDLDLIFIEMEAVDLIRQEKYDEALKIYENLQQRLPDNLLLNINVGQILLLKGDTERSSNLFQQVLANLEQEKSGDKNYEHQYYILYNNIAWANASNFQEELKEQSDDYSARALNSSPKFATYLGTRGAVLIRKGEIEKGMNLVRAAFKRHSDNAARSTEALFLGIGEAKLGNREKALKWLGKARKIHSHHAFFPSAEKEIMAIIDVNSGSSK